MWSIVTIFFAVLYVLKFLREVVIGVSGFIDTLPVILGLAIVIYELWVVYVFMTQLKEGGWIVETAGCIQGPSGGSEPPEYDNAKPCEEPGQTPPPSYEQTQAGYAAVPRNPPCYPSAPPDSP